MGEIAGVEFRNPAQWTFQLRDIDSFYIHDFEINVNIVKQLPRSM